MCVRAHIAMPISHTLSHILVDVVALKAQAAVRQAVDGGRVDFGVAAVAQIVPAEIVRLEKGNRARV